LANLPARWCFFWYPLRQVHWLAVGVVAVIEQ